MRPVIALALVCVLGTMSVSAAAAAAANPGRILAVDQGHVFFESGDVYQIEFGQAGFTLAFRGNVYQQLGLPAPGAAGVIAPGLPGTAAPSTPSGITSSPSEQRQQCAAITKRGTRCSRMAQPGRAYCWQHGR